jgi:thioredoxin-dependent peroxiredoxin
MRTRRNRFLVAGLASSAALAAAVLVQAAEPTPTPPPAPPAAGGGYGAAAPPAPITAADLLPVGSPAPNFTTVVHDGKKVELAKLKGKTVALFFYPMDDTPGCTKEACDFRDSWDKLQKAGVVVFGISTQDNASHKAFADKYKLPMQLIPDEKGEIAGKYKVPVVNGKARRITYLIGKDGKIKHVWPKVTPVGHATEVLAQVEPPTAAAAK